VTATSADLANGVWFWRVSGPSAFSDAVWSFRVHHVKGVKDAGTLRDGWDVNCDGRADILLRGAVALGGDPPVTVSCDLGPLAVRDLEPVPDRPGPEWGQLVGVGDIDGDGCDDVMALATRVAPDMYVNRHPPIPILFRGQPGLTSKWQATSRSPRLVTAIGDINVDGYADTAECSKYNCTVYLGSRGGVQEQPFITFNGYDALLGGDFDADGLPDVWALSQTNRPGPRLAFFSGKVPFSSAPQSSFILPAALNGLPASGLIANGRSAIVGFARDTRSDSFWSAANSLSSVTVQRWPETHAAPAWSRRFQVGPWAFIPFTGPGTRGVLVVSRMRTERESDPTQLFLQLGFSANGTPSLLATPTLSKIGHQESISGFAPAGDTNGDGYDELLVHVIDDFGGELSYEFTGSENGFKYSRQL